MSTDFRFHGRHYRAGLTWEQAPGGVATIAPRRGLIWLTRAVHRLRAGSIVRSPPGMVGFDRRANDVAALLPVVCRTLGLGSRDSLIVLLGEDPPNKKATTPRRHAVLVMADGALIPGGSDLVFADRGAALAHIDSLTADRTWPRLVYDARMSAAALSSSWQAHDFGSMVAHADEYLRAPPLAVQLALSPTLRILALIVVLAALALWAGFSWFGASAPRPAPLPRVSKALPRYVPARAFITACDQALLAHPPGLPGWAVSNIRCYLATPPGKQGPSAITDSAQLVLSWHPAEPDPARARRLADAFLAAGYPWSLVMGESAQAAVPLALTPVPLKDPPALGQWRRALDDALGAHAERLAVDLASGRVSFESADPLARIAARLAADSLEVYAMTKTATGWRFDGRRPNDAPSEPERSMSS